MSLNLPLPPLNRAAVRSVPAPNKARRRNRITLHPRYAAWLNRAGLESPEAIFDLPGEVVSGHPDRHVVRVELPTAAGKRTLYLKRELSVSRSVRFKNYRAGFGWVSRCEREAETLLLLERSGLPGPQWLAFGTTSEGKAFLLLDELTGLIELRALLQDRRLSFASRRRLASELGRSVAELHAAGFAPPDLSAKHVFVDSAGGGITVIDWHSAPKPDPVPIEQRIRGLARLHASLAPSLASPRDRLRVVRAYLGRIPDRDRPNRRNFIRAVEEESSAFERLSSVKDQRISFHAGKDLRLIWKAGEAVCVIPSIAEMWPNPAVSPPFYPGPDEALREPGEMFVSLPDGRLAFLTRYTTWAPFGRLLARMRGRPWRSPAANDARTLFQLQRFDAPAPRLLAFGQRPLSLYLNQSFLLTDHSPGAITLADRLSLPFHAPLDRFLFLRKCGHTVRALHDAGVRFSRTSSETDSLVVSSDDTGDGLRILSPAAVERTKRLSDRDRFADVQRILFAIHDVTSRADRLRVVLGYLDDTGGLPARWRRAVAQLIRN